MSHLAAVRAMLDQPLYQRYSPVLLDIKNLQPEHKQILNTIGEYWKRYPEKKSLTVDELKTFFSIANPAWNKEAVAKVLNGMETLDIPNGDLIRDVLNHFLELHAQAQISQLANEVMNGSRASALLEQKKLIETQEELIRSINPVNGKRGYREHIRDIRTRNREGSVEWRTAGLNRILGPVRPGTLGHIFARPNAGKTSFAIYNSTFWACLWQKRNIPGEILYLQNEEHPGNIRQRMMQCVLGKTEAQLDEDYDAAEKEFAEKTGDRIIIESEVTHMRRVVKHVEDGHQLRVVVLDQGPKVAIPGGREVTGPERLQQLYNLYRELAKKYNLIFITLGQADAASKDKKYLWLDNMDNSKTGIPGELDWALGIGQQVDRPGLEEVRWLNVAKSKLNGTGGHIEVRFDNTIVRYKEVTQ